MLLTQGGQGFQALSQTLPQPPVEEEPHRDQASHEEEHGESDHPRLDQLIAEGQGYHGHGLQNDEAKETVGKDRTSRFRSPMGVP